MAILDQVKSLARSQLTRWMAAAGVVVVSIAAASWRGWLAGPWLWASVTFLAAGGLFAAVYWGIPWLRERRFLQQEGAKHVIGSGESPEEYRAKFNKALQSLTAMPQFKGSSDPLYALPWYLLIGMGGCGKTAAVQSSRLFTPLFTPSSETAATANYDWWVARTAVVLDTAGRYAEHGNVEQDRAEWYRLLMLLRQHRDREPINGIIVAVAADWLASQPEDRLRAAASTLRDRIEEAIRTLGADFPVYVLVTKCDAIEGFAEFHAKLPAHVSDEVVGYVDEHSASGTHDKGYGAAALERLQAGLEGLYQRLHFFRAALLDSGVPEPLRPAIFCFPEEFRALEGPIISFAEPLFSEAVKYHTPLFRGIFFASARQVPQRLSLLRGRLRVGGNAHPGSEGSKGYFLADLFGQILPRDRGLVAVTPEAHRRRGLLRAVVMVTIAGALLTAAALVGRQYVLDRRLVASVDPAACPEGVPRPSEAPQLAGADRCRNALDKLARANAERSGWGSRLFGRSRMLEETLRARYVQQFQAQVLTPLNQQIDRAFTATEDPLPLMLLVARRIQVNRRCLSASGCSQRQLDELDSDHRPVLTIDSDRRAPPEAPSTLARTYAAYVRWQEGAKEPLRRDIAADEKRLQQWLSTKQFSLDKLLPLVNKQSPPLTFEDYWKLPAPISANAPQIDASCTKQVWEEMVAPFLQQLQDAVRELAPRLKDFQSEYRSTCLAQWHKFLADFPRGSERWTSANQERTLALELLTDASPCQRVIDDAVANLPPWLPRQGEPAEAAKWAAALNQWAGSEQRRAYLDALKKVHGQLERCPSSDSCVKLAQEVFAEGDPSAESASALNRAAWIAEQAGGQTANGNLLVPLLEQPIELVWSVILEGAEGAMQQRWQQDVAEPLRALSPAEQLLQMYGPGGRVGGFLDRVVKPALGGKDPTTLAEAGKRLPLSPAFEKILTTYAELQPLLDGSGGPLPITIEAGPTRLESHKAFRGEQTILAVSCGGKTYRITNRPDDPAEATVSVPWSSQTCTNVTITIYFHPGLGPLSDEEKQSSKRLELSKSYAGAAGFLQFLQDFESGSHRFVLDDLSGDPDSLRSGVHSVNVTYRLDMPPALGKVLAAMQQPLLPEDIAAQ
jgi:type VI secretion system protein ImpL